MTFRNFPQKNASPTEPEPKRFGRREPGALDALDERDEGGAAWTGKAKAAAFIAGCAVLGALAAGVI